MNAVISGGTGKALLLEGGRFTCLDLKGELREVPCNVSTVIRLLGEGLPRVYLEDTTLDAVRAQLDLETRRETALRLVLSLFDRELPRTMRRNAAVACEELLIDRDVWQYVENVLYARPLPASAQAETAITVSRQARASLTVRLLKPLVQAQSAVREVYRAWEESSRNAAFSTAERETALVEMIRRGVFGVLGRAVVERWLTDRVQSQVLSRLDTCEGAIQRIANALVETLSVAGVFSISAEEPSKDIQGGHELQRSTRRESPELLATLAHLWREFKERGSLRARDTIIEHYTYLITRARQSIIPTVPVKIAAEDLEQEGLIALVKAVGHFDPRRKIKFEPYAVSIIRGAMIEYLRREDWVPRSVRSKQKLLHRAEEELMLTTGIQHVADADMAKHLDMPIDTFYRLYYEANVLQVVSLEDAVGDSAHEDLDPLVVLESVKSKEPDPDLMAIVESQKSLMMRCISWLPLQERTVVVLYYYEGWTLKQIAKHLGRSESRAHQLHAQAMSRLSGFMDRQRGLFFPETLPTGGNPSEAELESASVHPLRVG